jgi:hypothetical protein
MLLSSLSAGALLLGACNAPPPQSPAESATQSPVTVTPPPSGPPVSINAIMVSLVDHASHALWDAEREGQRPATPADWERIAEHATQLAAAGTLITLPGTGANDVTLTGQADWKKWSRAMSDAGMAALKATEAEDLDRLVAANGDLVESCESCHKAFKPSLPSEGIHHQHMHMVP